MPRRTGHQSDAEMIRMRLMASIQIIAVLVGFLLLSLLMAYGRTRWFGKKLHRAIFAAYLLDSFSLLSFILFFGWQTASSWRLILLISAVATWLCAVLWARRLGQGKFAP